MTHLVFDLIAALTSIIAGYGVYHFYLRNAIERTVSRLTPFYFLALSVGSIGGAYILGTANLYLSGEFLIGRSILGALFGAIITIEIYKIFKHIKGSTGYMYVVPFTVIVIIGRLGCFYAGLDDHTYGIITNVSWAVDFGDGIQRHPVQLYESFSMFCFLIISLLLFKYQTQFFIANGFYLCTGFYAAQRFFWEFLKPYSTWIGGLNIFQVACLILIIYSLVMIGKVKNGYFT
ncbi:MAG: prolipoprotein diacylglyceryl transferase [Emcibacteraceae bacterium]